MARIVAPGVFADEVPAGVRAIAGVSTSTAAFVGTAPRGRAHHATLVTSLGDFERRFGDPHADSDLSASVRLFFQNGGTRAYVVRTMRPEARAAAAKLSIGADTLGVVARNPGAWGNAIQVRWRTHPSDAGRFELEVQLEAETESFSTLAAELRTVLHRDSRLIRIEDGFASTAAVEQQDFTPWTRLEDGSDASFGPLDPNEVEAALAALDSIDDVSILAIPGGDASVIAIGITYAERRRDLIYVVDSPRPRGRESRSDVRMLQQSLPRTSYAALYYPWLRVLRSDGSVRMTPPSGMIAGVYCRTDQIRGVWKAPAGTSASVLGIAGVESELSNADHDSLNEVGINCIRSFANVGPVVWGAQTLAASSSAEYRYVSSRRLALFLERSIALGTRWAVFEPNDEPLWSSLRASVESFMSSLFRTGAFQGATPAEAFFVRCGPDTHSEAALAVGELNIWVGFAAERPAEFISLHIQHRLQP